MRKIVYIALWSLFTVGLFVLMGFAGREHDKLRCTRMDIDIRRGEEHRFVTEGDIRNLLKERGHPVEGEPMASIDVHQLEKLIATHPGVETVDVFVTVSGVVHVQAVQRRPIVRIINERDESFYIDDRGRLMPWSEDYTAPVLVVNGAISDGYGNMYTYGMSDLESDTLIEPRTMLDEIYQVALYIDADTFMRDQIAQLHVRSDKVFELTPRIGDHKIIFGEANDVAEKFEKLFAFYTEGLNATGNWNRYSVINLEYKNQVVCTKRPTQTTK